MVTNLQIRGKLKFYSKPYGRQWKWRYQVHGRMIDPNVHVPKELEGVKIIDPLRPETTVPATNKPKWTPPRRHPLLESFFPSLTVRDHPHYHEQPIKRFTNTVKFHAGIDQVCLLTKTKAIGSFPAAIDLKKADELNTSNQYELVTNCIRQALAFDAHKERCPGYKPVSDVKFHMRAEYATPYKRRMEILMENLLRLANSNLYRKFPSLIVDRNEYKNCAQLSMLTRGDDRIQIDRNHDLVITSKSRPSPVASHADVEQTRAHSFVDMYPIYPTVDLREENVYDETRPYVTGVVSPTLNHVHTFVNLNDDEFTPLQDLTRLMMFAFGTAYGQYLAQKPSVESDGRLKSPIVVNGISMQYERFNFVTFQLNTVNLAGNDGVKNLCYYDADSIENNGNNQIYSNKLSRDKLPYLTHKNLQRLALDHLEYNPLVFKKLSALLLSNASAATATVTKPETSKKAN